MSPKNRKNSSRRRPSQYWALPDAHGVQIYLHADMTIKERALARITPPGTTPGR
jgi:hypothetical protein